MPQPCRVDACRRYSKFDGMCLYHMRDVLPLKASPAPTTTADAPPAAMSAAIQLNRPVSHANAPSRPSMASAASSSPSKVSAGGPIKTAESRASTATGPYHQPQQHRRWIAISKVRYHHTGWIKCLVPQCHSEAKRHFAFCSAHENSVVCIHERTKQYLATSQRQAAGDAAPVDRVTSMPATTHVDQTPKDHHRMASSSMYMEPNEMHHHHDDAMRPRQNNTRLNPIEL